MGFETNAGAWTLLKGPVSVTPNASPAMTRVADNFALSIPAGQTYAFYLTATNAVYNSYHNGTGVGNTNVADANITIKQGTGNGYPFGGVFNPRVWEGTIGYTTTKIDSGVAGATVGDGVMFDLATSANVKVASMGAQLAAGTFTVSVFFKRGTHVGAEANAPAWELLGTQANVVSAGPGAVTNIPFATPVTMASGSTSAFYVTTGANTNGVRFGNGTAVGNTAATNGPLTLKEGVSVAGAFGAKTATRVFNGTIVATTCN